MMKTPLRILVTICTLSVLPAESVEEAIKNSPLLDAPGSKTPLGKSKDPDIQTRLESQASMLFQGIDKVQKDARKKTSDIVKRSEAVLDVQEAQLKRFDKILATWEKQQAQYQRYLDSLEKK